MCIIFIEYQDYMQVRGSKRLSCHADFYAASRCHTRGESKDHTCEKARKKGSTLALKPRADITRSPKQGYQWPHQKNLCPQETVKKKREKNSTSIVCTNKLSARFQIWKVFISDIINCEREKIFVERVSTLHIFSNLILQRSHLLH